jgi:hypothetical protein
VVPDPEILGREPVQLERRRESSEILGDPLAAATWHVPRWVIWAVTLGLVAGLWVDHWVDGREAVSIADCDSRLRAASHEYDLRMGAMYIYIRPAWGELSGRQISLLMAQPAKRVLPDALTALRRCQVVHVAPWHSSHVARRGAHVAYASALVARLQGVAGRQPRFNMYDGYLDRLRAAAGIPAALKS